MNAAADAPDPQAVQLLLLCLRPAGVDPARLRRHVAALHDWKPFIAAALGHQVVPQVQTALLRQARDLVPGDIRSALALYCDRQARWSRQAVDRLARILQALEQRSVHALPLKGPVLAVQAFGDVTRRTFQDLDLLVPRGAHPAVADALASLGYHNEGWKTPVTARLSWNYYGQDIFFAGDGGAAVEPHWSLAPDTFRIPFDLDAARHRSGVVTACGHHLPAPSIEDHLLMVCIHGGKECWVNLKQVSDLAGLVVRHPDLDWDLVREQAKASRARRMLWVGVGLAERLLGASTPPALRAELDADGTARALIDELEHGLRRGPSQIPDLYVYSPVRARMRDRRMDVVAQTLRTGVRASDRHFRMVSLPRQLDLLYGPIKLVHDYLLLPAWRGLRGIAPRLRARLSARHRAPATAPRPPRRRDWTSPGRNSPRP